MYLRNRSAIFFFLALFFLSSTASAKTYSVPPSNSPKKNNATRNILDGIDALKKRGYTREAAQLRKLLDDGRIRYRTTGKHRNDAQFVHGLLPGEPDTLYFGVQHVKYIQGKGTQRFDKDNQRYLYLFVLVAMHELTHKDQGKASIISSESLKGSRGYSLHEIEAYRASLKKFAKKWVVEDIEDYLKTRKSLDDKQKLEALKALRHKLFALENSLGAPGGNGDRACRWKAIQKEVAKLRNDLDALWLDQASKLSCQANLRGGDVYKQLAVEFGLKSRALRKKIGAKNTRIRTVRKKIRARKRAHDGAQRKLTRAKSQKRRLELAAIISKHSSALGVLRKELAGAKQARAPLRKQLKDLKAKRAAALKKYKTAAANDDQCRIDYVKKRVVQYKLKASQLPPDMVKTRGGGLKIVGRKRKIDLKKTAEAIKKLFDYSGKLLSATAAIRHKDPRTPCHKTTGKKTESKKPAAKTKTVCRGGGLVGRMNCVTKKIERGR